MLFVLQRHPCNLLDAYELALIQAFSIELSKTPRVKNTVRDAEIHNCAQTLTDTSSVADISFSSNPNDLSVVDDLGVEGNSFVAHEEQKSATLRLFSGDPIPIPHCSYPGSSGSQAILEQGDSQIITASASSDLASGAVQNLPQGTPMVVLGSPWWPPPMMLLYFVSPCLDGTPSAIDCCLCPINDMDLLLPWNSLGSALALRDIFPTAITFQLLVMNLFRVLSPTSYTLGCVLDGASYGYPWVLILRLRYICKQFRCVLVSVLM